MLPGRNGITAVFVITVWDWLGLVTVSIVSLYTTIENIEIFKTMTGWKFWLVCILNTESSTIWFCIRRGCHNKDGRKCNFGISIVICKWLTESLILITVSSKTVNGYFILEIPIKMDWYSVTYRSKFRCVIVIKA